MYCNSVHPILDNSLYLRNTKCVMQSLIIHCKSLDCIMHCSS